MKTTKSELIKLAIPPAIIGAFVGVVFGILSSVDVPDVASKALSNFVYYVVWDDDTRTNWDEAMAEVNAASEEVFKESVLIAIEALSSEEAQKELEELRASGKDYSLADLKSLEPFMDKLNGFDAKAEAILNKHGFYRNTNKGLKENLVSYGGYVAR